MNVEERYPQRAYIVSQPVLPTLIEGSHVLLVRRMEGWRRAHVAMAAVYREGTQRVYRRRTTLWASALPMVLFWRNQTYRGQHGEGKTAVADRSNYLAAAKTNIRSTVGTPWRKQATNWSCQMSTIAPVSQASSDQCKTFEPSLNVEAAFVPARCEKCMCQNAGADPSRSSRSGTMKMCFGLKRKCSWQIVVRRSRATRTRGLRKWS